MLYGLRETCGGPEATSCHRAEMPGSHLPGFPVVRAGVWDLEPPIFPHPTRCTCSKGIMELGVHKTETEKASLRPLQKA